MKAGHAYFIGGPKDGQIIEVEYSTTLEFPDFGEIEVKQLEDRLSPVDPEDFYKSIPLIFHRYTIARYLHKGNMRAYSYDGVRNAR